MSLRSRVDDLVWLMTGYCNRLLYGFRLCPCVLCAPCVSRLPPVSFYGFQVSVPSQFRHNPHALSTPPLTNETKGVGSKCTRSHRLKGRFRSPRSTQVLTTEYMYSLALGLLNFQVL